MFFPERLRVKPDMLSPTQLSMLCELERAALVRSGENFVGPIKPTIPKGVEKLIPNLYNKTRYVLHSRNLKQYTDLGK